MLHYTSGQCNSILLVQSIDEKVQKALECPCVADLKNGPCGGPFVDAFSCFLRSTEEEKVVYHFSFLQIRHMRAILSAYASG